MSSNNPWDVYFAETEQKDTAFELAMSLLDEDQTHVAAWRPEDGNLRVQATAGSGKTTALVALAASLLRSGLDPATLIVTTFARKAADEIQSRLLSVVPTSAREMNLSTWHGLALRVLRARGEKWDVSKCVDMPVARRSSVTPSFNQIWRDVIGWEAIEALNGRKGLDLTKKQSDPVRDAYRLARANGLFVEDVLSSDSMPQPITGLLKTAWSMYNELKAVYGVWDWDDVLYRWREVLQSAPRQTALTVLVDEAQDNSKLQLEIAQSLASHPDGRLVLVGDSRQAIHTWRGAWPELFIEAEELLGATTRYLKRTYRCPRSVVDLANKSVDGETWAEGPAAWAHKETAGIVTAQQGESPAEIYERVTSGESPDKFAILCRTNAEVGAAALQLLAAGVNAKAVGQRNLLKHRVALDMLAWAQCAENPTEEAWMRVYRTPTRFLRKTWAGAVWRRTQQDDGSPAALYDAALREPTRASEHPTLLRDLAAVAALPSFAERLEYIRTDVLGLATWPGLRASSANRRENEERSRDDRVADALCELALRFPSLAELRSLEDLSADPQRPSVTLSTIHRAKGLEWDTVYLRAAHGKLPLQHANPAEERRLLYVGITRAKEELHFRFPSRPSPYLTELQVL